MSFWAIIVALILQYQLCSIDLQKISDLFIMNKRDFATFTPYFPGFDNLETHEVFDTAYDNKKKILFLGVSYVDSMGCDQSWSYPDTTRDPERNVHFSCRIDHRLTQLLKDSGRDDWVALNLARSASLISSSVYTYVAVHKIHPEIIIYGGDTALFSDNGEIGLDNVRASRLESFFVNANNEKLYELWESFKQSLRCRGWKANTNMHESLDFVVDPFSPMEKVTIRDWLRKMLVRRLENINLIAVPPLPIKLYPWENGALSERKEFVAPKEGYDFSLITGLEIINTLQHEHNGGLIVYQTPNWTLRNMKGWDSYFSEPLSELLDKKGITNFDLTDVPMVEGVDVYNGDGRHHTKYGNKKIAEHIFNYLIDHNVLDKYQ